MSIDRLTRQVDAFRTQSTLLKECADQSDPEGRARLANVFEQLQSRLAELQESESELRFQQAALLERQAILEADCQQYRELFELASVAHLVTDPIGRSREANHAASTLLGASPWLLVDKPLAASVAERPVPVTFFTAPRPLAELRARAEAADAHHRSLFEAAADAMVLYGLDGHVLDGNSAAEKLLGYNRQEVRQLRLSDLAVLEDELSAEGIANLQSNRSWRGELEVRPKNSRTIQVEVAMATVDLPTGPVRQAALRDISDRPSARREPECRHHDVVAMISHELMNPLNGILLHAELLKMLGSYRERSVDAILTSAHQEQRLIEDLVDLSRADAGRLRLRPSQVDLVQVLRPCITQQQALTSSHDLRLDAPFEMPPGFWDPGRLGQICHNLLANAMKYSPNGGEILVRVEDFGEHAQISVVDHGLGVDPETLPHIFDRFFRAPGVDEGVGGLGLGLYITKMLVEAHGGAITADSELGRGSVFRVTLPYDPPLDGSDRS